MLTLYKNSHSVKVQLNPRTGQESREGGDRSLDKPLTAKVVGIDRGNLPFLVFGDSDALKQGEIVLALGNPMGAWTI